MAVLDKQQPHQEHYEDFPVEGWVPVSDVIAAWRPGSGDWDWWAEYKDLRINLGDRFAQVRAEVQQHGVRHPVLLGDDGRVWDGHKRLLSLLLTDEKARVPVAFGHSTPLPTG